ncbi:MAG: hypothetical protein KUA43_07215 [Hoeflea sp.]|uniref:hypothetical protein n=1 Tax=Hoeflea sp. TaxID=1940281 RepID=UPI001D5E19B0|nr:hypothetical protein [Hoeflea sp.]MBU4529294.1 hypothetical protein [Alphaproteobacteria bacterium]MBU4545461.1 hypothetical protein [Alphaproteobacteria bacterium]MBU4550176.1 hypothetical protein [Alphaproteobacteria bacterium]MBV1723217.1 hypothetical protein [Hoeflea sp.]MBV1782890.1 hypothetical protein [Hoeflea sp.]
MPDGTSILTVNGGSSSNKFALQRMGDPPRRGLRGKIDCVGLSGASIAFNDPARKLQDDRGICDLDHRSTANFLLDGPDGHIGLAAITALGHRFVSGGTNYRDPLRFTQERPTRGVGP